MLGRENFRKEKCWGGEKLMRRNAGEGQCWKGVMLDSRKARRKSDGESKYW